MSEQLPRSSNTRKDLAHVVAAGAWEGISHVRRIFVTHVSIYPYLASSFMIIRLIVSHALSPKMLIELQIALANVTLGIIF